MRTETEVQNGYEFQFLGDPAVDHPSAGGCVCCDAAAQIRGGMI